MSECYVEDQEPVLLVGMVSTHRLAKVSSPKTRHAINIVIEVLFSLHKHAHAIYGKFLVVKN